MNVACQRDRFWLLFNVKTVSRPPTDLWKGGETDASIEGLLQSRLNLTLNQSIDSYYGIFYWLYCPFSRAGPVDKNLGPFIFSVGWYC